MSKIKRSLPEDIDITNPDEPDFITDDREEMEVGFVAFGIDTGIGTLEKTSVRLEPDELRGYASRLQDLAARIEKPF